MIGLMRKLIGLITGFISPFVFVSPAFAAIKICPGVEPGSNFEKLCTIDFTDFGSIISKLITLILIVAIVVAVFFLIYGGIRWILSGGDKTAVESARNHIVAAIVGLVIALLAFFIINIIGGLFGISLTNLQLPTLK